MNERENDRNDRRRDADRSGDRSPRSGGQGAPRKGQGSFDRKPRREGEYRQDRKPRRDGESGYDRRPRRDGEGGYERKPRGNGEGGYDRRTRRDGEGGYDRKPRRDGEGGYDRRPRRDGGSQDRRPRRDGDRPFESRPRRDGEGGYERKPRGNGEGGYDRRPRREGDGGYERKPRRDGDRGYDRRPSRDGGRDGDRGYRGRDTGDRRDLGRGGTRGGGRSDRGGRDREFTEAERLQHELRPVRSEHDDPSIPDEVTPFDLHPGARNELKTLQPETQERVARHLAMVAALIDTDPELAHQHAISATRRAGRIPVARETLAVTAYRIGDYALALRELRTFRRLTGSQGHLALMVECERALGRPERGIETGLAADLGQLNAEQRVQLAIAMSGARLDLGQTQQALFELEIPELDPERAFTWSPELFAAYSAVLEDLGRDTESEQWHRRALMAEEALDEHFGAHDQLEVLEIVEMRLPYEPAADAVPEADVESETAPEAGAEPAPEADAEPESETPAEEA